MASTRTERLRGYRNFSIDWEHQQARCPQGQISSSWTPTWTRNQEMIKIKFGFAGCSACPVRAEVVPKRGEGASRYGGMRPNLLL